MYTDICDQAGVASIAATSPRLAFCFNIFSFREILKSIKDVIRPMGTAIVWLCAYYG
ncbi:MAG: hypothetical protein QOK38_2051 [Acidobacteriaceae bacterium]|jgi:hypothetical protein|nr:hypothetical protein [Acidobacteriaceae bacterium]